MNNPLLLTIVGLLIILVVVLIIFHFLIGSPGGTVFPTPTPITTPNVTPTGAALRLPFL